MWLPKEKPSQKVNDLVIFVPYVVPGDVVDLQIKRKKNKYAEAEAVKFHELSPNRAVPFCQHYGVCGGCKWQVLPPIRSKSGISKSKWKII